MSTSHKEALAVGRDEGRAVRRYLEALEANRPRPGRKRTASTVERQLKDTLGALDNAKPLERVHLLQRRLDLETELEHMQNGPGINPELEGEFLAALPGYSVRKNISYAAWREAGVSAAVLRQAGVRRAAS